MSDTCQALDAAQCYARVFEGHPTPGGAGGGGGDRLGVGAKVAGRGATKGQAGARQRMRDRRWEQRADEIENYEDDAFAVFGKNPFKPIGLNTKSY